MTDLTEEFEVEEGWAEKYCYSRAWSLPRRGGAFGVNGDGKGDTGDTGERQERYEVVVSGAGPAGLFLTLLLARYGLTDASVLCVDAKPRRTELGHADGINARTVEVLATLGLEHDVLKHGREFTGAAAWHRTAGGGKLERTEARPFFFCPARFGQCYGIHQGRVERVLSEDLGLYVRRGVRYGLEVVGARVDEEGDGEFPVVVEVREGGDGEVRTLRTKYLVGADGAHSAVRRAFNVEMRGDSTDEIWGVVDFVPETDFPDIRRVVRFFPETDANKMEGLLIPREKLSSGDYLCRMYVDMSAGAARDDVVVVGDERGGIRRKKAEIKKTHILERVGRLVAPYSLGVKAGTNALWWATYSVGQRLAEKFIVDDSAGHPRVFLVGDACHSHSPRQGQGLNISTQDAYYLSWRLAYALNGLSPDPTMLLQSYEDERRAWAERVVTSDKRWNDGSLPFYDMFTEMREQVLGCGVEEKPGLLISEKNEAVAWQGRDLLNGVLRTGRRLFNVKITRWADGTLLDLHDDFPSDGRYRILVLAGNDFPQGHSRRAIESACALVARYAGLLEEVVLQPKTDIGFEWSDMPALLKQQAEMRLHTASQDVYDTYGVSPDHGALALVRPDGIVGVTVGLEGIGEIERMLRRVFQTPGLVTTEVVQGEDSR